MKKTKKPRKKRETNEDICPICKQFMDVRCTGYSRSPFIDGRKYASICHTCWCVNKTWYYNEATDSFAGPYFDSEHIYTAEEMAQDGIDIKQAKISIRAVMASVRRHRA